MSGPEGGQGRLRAPRDRAERQEGPEQGEQNIKQETINNYYILYINRTCEKKALAKGQFDKVVKMIDNMVAELKKEQQDDEHYTRDPDPEIRQT